MRFALYAKYHMDQIPMGEVVIGLYADQVTAFRDQVAYEKYSNMLAVQIGEALGAEVSGYGVRDA